MLLEKLLSMVRRRVVLPAPCPTKGCQKTGQFVFTLKMAAAMPAETLDSSQHSTRLMSESRGFISVTSVHMLFKDTVATMGFT
jgi:hypothetical protein